MLDACLTRFGFEIDSSLAWRASMDDMNDGGDERWSGMLPDVHLGAREVVTECDEVTNASHHSASRSSDP